MRVLGLVLEDLENEGLRLLVVLDGFDYALAGTGLTRNLWDQTPSTGAEGRVSGWLLEAGDHYVNCAKQRSLAPLISGRSSTTRPTRVGGSRLR